jgi:hypothetical protein
MKYSLYTIILLTVACYSSGEPFDDDEYRRIAWEYIDGDHDETIIGGMYDGEVSEYMDLVTPMVGVTWHTTEDALLGPITVNINRRSKCVVGITPRD